MKGLVLDTGALIALERDQSRLRTLLEQVRDRHYELRTTAPVLTEFLGGSPRARRPAAEYVCSKVRVAVVDEGLARRAARLRQLALDGASRASPDAIDALVSTEAETEAVALIIDGDRADFDALADASGAITVFDLAEIA